MTGVTGAS